MSEPDLRLAALDFAREAVSKAENQLDGAISDLPRAPRADKVTVSEVVTEAFSELENAKSALAELEISKPSEKKA